MIPANVILENSLHAFYLCSSDEGEITYSNELFNDFASHISPTNIEHFITIDNDKDLMKKAMDKAVERSPFPSSFQCRLKQKNGASRWSTWEVAFGLGTFHFMGIQLFDVVSISSHEYDTQRRVLENIAWIQSHKVRKPLANIIALSELIAKTPGIDKDKLEVISMLKTSSEELDDVIREITTLCNSVK
jgi:hypothetical protein